VANDSPERQNTSWPIAQHFSHLARSYGDGAYYTRRRIAGLAAIAPELEAADRILDLGCGNGACLRDLTGIGAAKRIVGADLTLAMLAEARRRIGSRAHFVQADAVALPFRPGSWDLVFCSHLLQLVPDLDRCVSEIARSLKPNGVLVTTLEDGAFGRVFSAILSRGRLDQLRQAVLSAPRPEPGDHPVDKPYHAAFVAAGLVPESRDQAFTVGWQDIDEWVRVRWFKVVPESVRDEMDRTLTRLAGDESVRNVTLKLAQWMLIGRKPAAPTGV
jgi:SAM-dependent methyltransferase